MSAARTSKVNVFGQLSEEQERDACIADELNVEGLVWMQWSSRIRDVLNRAANNYRRRAKLRGLVTGYVRAVTENIQIQKTHEGALEELLVIEAAFSDAIVEARRSLATKYEPEPSSSREEAA